MLKVTLTRQETNEVVHVVWAETVVENDAALIAFKDYVRKRGLDPEQPLNVPQIQGILHDLVAEVE